MAVLGLVVCVHDSPELLGRALEGLAALPGLTLKERRGARIAAVVCGAEAATRGVLDAAALVPGVVAVLPVFHAREDEVAP